MIFSRRVVHENRLLCAVSVHGNEYYRESMSSNKINPIKPFYCLLQVSSTSKDWDDAYLLSASALSSVGVKPVQRLQALRKFGAS